MNSSGPKSIRFVACGHALKLIRKGRKEPCGIGCILRCPVSDLRYKTYCFLSQITAKYDYSNILLCIFRISVPMKKWQITLYTSNQVFEHRRRNGGHWGTCPQDFTINKELPLHFQKIAPFSQGKMPSKCRTPKFAMSLFSSCETAIYSFGLSLYATPP